MSRAADHLAGRRARRRAFAGRVAPVGADAAGGCYPATGLAASRAVSVPGSDEVGEQVDRAAQGAADRVDQNVSGQPPAAQQPAGR